MASQIGEDLDLSHRLDKALNALNQSSEKAAKKSAIADLKIVISDTDKNCLPELYLRISKCINTCLQDRFETCREQMVLITTEMLGILTPNGEYLVNLLPAVHRRIARESTVEPSEEIRLLLIKLVTLIVTRYSEHVAPFTEDLVEILSVSVEDVSPDVKKESSACIIKLSSISNHDFYKCSPKLIPPLIRSMVHQHWRVRVAVIQAIGSVVQFGDNKCVPDTTPPLAKRLFDDNPNVRLAVAKVVGTWLISLTDRYSYFPVLLPLILTCLTDESEDIVKEATFLWRMAGKQYLNENEKDYKDKIDYISENLDHYPKNVTRPHLGCRILVEREGGKFLLALGKEICDWVVNIRIKSAQLLSQVVLHMETSITQQIHKIITPMCKAAMDEEPAVVKYVVLSAEYMGYFVPASVYSKLIIETMSEANHGELRVVAGLVRGSRKQDFIQHITSVGSLLTNSTFKAEEQLATLCLIESVFRLCEQDSFTIGNEIFQSLFSVIGLAATEDISYKALDLLDVFCQLGSDKNGKVDRKTVMNKYCSGLLDNLNQTASCWTVHCHQQFIFNAVVTHAGEIINDNITTILSILKVALSRDSDPEAVLKAMMATNAIIAERDTTLPNQETYSLFVNTLLSDVLSEELRWRAGRSAEAIRTAAASCLYSCLSGADSLYRPPKELLVTDILPVLLSLVEDASLKTRTLAVRSLATLAPSLVLERERFSNVVLIVLKRLDDCEKIVREQSVNCIQDLYRARQDYLRVNNEDCLNTGLLEFVFTTLLIHLDDHDSELQLRVLDCIKNMAPLNKEILQSKICSANFRDKDICETLLTFLV